MGYLTLPSNTQKQLKNVDMSAVTQAANQSNLSGRGYSTPSSSSTSISNAGTSGYIPFAQTAKNANLPGVTINQQGNIQGQTNVGGGGPGGISKGSYSAQDLTQDQRQWLWEQFGHKGQAPVGYGGESTAPAFIPSLGNIVQRFAPPFVPPPSPTPNATVQPKGASGATAPQLSLSTGGGTSGMAFPALTQAGQATKGLQIPGLASGVISALTSGAGQIGKDVAGALGTFANTFSGVGQTPQAQTQTQKPQFSQDWQKGAQEAYSKIGQPAILSQILSGIKNPETIPGFQTAGDIIFGGGLGSAPEAGAKLGMEGISGILPKLEEAVPLIKSAAQKAAPITGAVASYLGLAPKNKQEASYNLQTKQAGTVDKSGKMTPYAPGTFTANQGMLSGNLQGKDAQQAIASVSNGTAKIGDVAAGIASPEAPAMVQKAITQAQKAGDMGAVSRLANLSQAVQQQLDFIQRIGQIVTALSAGFGSQNSPGVTESRTPMVQQGIGQALTGMNQSPTAPIGQQPTSEIPYLPTNLQTASPTQQNRPVLNPFMS